MATAFEIPASLPATVADSVRLAPVQMPEHANDNRDAYAALRREQASVGQQGVHPYALGLCMAGYGLMLLAFWVMFGRDLAAGLVLAVTSVLMLVYFSLILGGIAFADTPTPGTLRSFGAFLDGTVQTASGPVSGRIALMMIAGLPFLLAVMAMAIGLIARFTLA